MKEPKQVVYEDGYLGSGANHGSIEDPNSQDSENAGDRTILLERKEAQKFQQSKASTTEGQKVCIFVQVVYLILETNVILIMIIL